MLFLCHLGSLERQILVEPYSNAHGTLESEIIVNEHGSKASFKTNPIAFGTLEHVVIVPAEVGPYTGTRREVPGAVGVRSGICKSCFGCICSL